MIQYNNFLMKREQSRAGSRFAECEKSRLKAKILITLALLLTAVTGAWADGVKLTTAELVPTPAWDGNYNDMALSDMPGLTADGITEEQAKAWSDVPKSGNVDLIYGYVEHETYMDYKIVQFLDGEFLLSITKGVTYQSVFNDYSQSNKTYYATGVASAEAPLTVEWNASTKTGTFSMPGSDVVLTPQYAPAAQLDKDGEPAAVGGLEIAADAAIITEGQSAQGTLLYAVTTSETEKPALDAFSATLPNAKVQTAAGNYYVWYYIQGKDTPQDQEPSAENTFNDSEIMGPLTVELLTNEHTLNIKQSPNITVTVAGTAKTPTDDKVTPVTTGQEVKIKANEGYKFRKVEVKKAEAAPAAPITVTWNNDDLTGSGKSFTKDGVTLTADNIDFREKNFMGGGTFTTTLGNFTKIEVTTGMWNASGSGWSGSTWTGTPASSVSFSGDIYGMGYTKFVFTIEPTN